jgi:hypothetical protein
MKYIIIAPHADDEIIGCYELLATGMVKSVLFPDETALKEAEKSSEHFLFSRGHIEDEDYYKSLEITYVFPDPYFETHPKHRELGSLGESLLRQHRHVIFYSTTMSAPYIHEVTQPALKRQCLNKLYPTKKDLWAYEHKFFLFEGYNKWILKWDDLF